MVGEESVERMDFVDDSKLDSVVSAIMAGTHTGSAGDGMIFISAVEGAYKIGTKEKIL